MDACFADKNCVFCDAVYVCCGNVTLGAIAVLNTNATTNVGKITLGTVTGGWLISVFGEVVTQDGHRTYQGPIENTALVLVGVAVLGEGQLGESGVQDAFQAGDLDGPGDELGGQAGGFHVRGAEA